MKKTTFIKKTWTENTGGGVMVEYVLLASGEVLGITSESVALYENEETAAGGGRAIQSLFLASAPATAQANNASFTEFFGRRSKQMYYYYELEPNGGDGVHTLVIYSNRKELEKNHLAEFTYMDAKEARNDIKSAIQDGFLMEELIQVHVRGGVAYCDSPSVEIIDHDNEKHS